jgi:hypothetical protein
LTAAGLASRFRGVSGYIPAWLAQALLECGQEREVRRQAGLGEWYCALQLARGLAGRGQVDAALDELRPFVSTGWHLAVCSAASLLEDTGRSVEAIDLLLLLSCGRVGTALGEARAYALRDPLDGPEFLAEVLCGAGQFDEGLAVVDAEGRGSLDSALVARLLPGSGQYVQAIAVFKGC